MSLVKKHSELFTTIAFIFTLAIVIFLFGPTSSIAYGAERTAEIPKLYCEYYDMEGNLQDGDHLTAGTYDVGFYVQGFDEISVVEITSTYDPSVVTVDGIVDSISSMSSMGSVTTNGDLVVGYVSAGDSVSVNPDGELIATARMSFDFEGVKDADEYLAYSSNPNLCFVVTNSANDNYDNEYALVSEFEGYNGTLSLMDYDITPSAGFTLNGKVMIATDSQGNYAGTGMVGIDVKVLDKDENVIASDVTASDGSYTLGPVPTGEYTLLISGASTVDRRVTLVVTESKELDSVGVVIADYNKDGLVNAADNLSFLTKFSSGEWDPNYDYNADGKINSADNLVFLAFFGKPVSYDSNVTLH